MTYDQDVKTGWDIIIDLKMKNKKIYFKREFNKYSSKNIKYNRFY